MFYFSVQSLPVVSPLRIYTLEKQSFHPDGHTSTDVESAPLLDDTLHSDVVFRRALEAELDKICSFYQVKEVEMFGEVDEVANDAEGYLSEVSNANIDPMSESVAKNAMSASSRPGGSNLLPGFAFGSGRRRSTDGESALVEDADSDEEDRPQLDQGVASANPNDANPSDSFYFGDSGTLGYTGQSGSRIGVDDHSNPRLSDLHDYGVSLRKRAIDAYVSICGLKSYIQLNKTGFSKALKKYDKIMDRSLRREFMNSTVSSSYPFTDSTVKKVDSNIARVEHVYADVVASGNLQLAKRELRLHLREHVVWERNTIWREMIGIERKAQAANVGIRRTLLGGDADPATAQRQGDEQDIKATELSTPLGRYRFPQWVCSVNFGTLVFVLVVFAILLSLPIMEKPEQQNCLAMLVLVSLLWATEVGLFIYASWISAKGNRLFRSSSRLFWCLSWSLCCVL